MNNKIELISVGADIEVFLKDKKTGLPVSAEGIVRGSKWDPYQFDETNPYFATSLDNVMCEFCVPPAKSAKEWIGYLNKALAYIKSAIPNDLDILIAPSANLEDKWLETENAQLFGCEPDFNAYTKTVNEKPMAEDYSLRSSGGHIHMGFDKIEVKFKGNIHGYQVDDQRAEIIKVLDLFVGVPSTILEPDNKRKELYGKAGAFRPKPYGLEYRTPSNFYLANNKLKKWAFDSVKNAFSFINKEGFLETGLAEYVQETINNNNKKSAGELVKEFNLLLV